MKKSKLDEHALMNELSGSAFFRGRTPAQPIQPDQAAEGSSDLKAERPHDQSVKRSFDLNKEAPIRRAFNFTEEELYAIEDIKIELSRKYDLQVTLYDVVRIGVHEIVEDYQVNGDNSLVVKRAKSKIPK